MRKNNLLFIGLIILAISVFGARGVAQSTRTDPTLGVHPFATYDVSNIDYIDLATGRLTVHIPLLSYKQLGRLPDLEVGLQFTGLSETVVLLRNCYEFSDPEDCDQDFDDGGFDGCDASDPEGDCDADPCGENNPCSCEQEGENECSQAAQGEYTPLSQPQNLPPATSLPQEHRGGMMSFGTGMSTYTSIRQYSYGCSMDEGYRDPPPSCDPYMLSDSTGASHPMLPYAAGSQPITNYTADQLWSLPLRSADATGVLQYSGPGGWYIFVGRDGIIYSEGQGQEQDGQGNSIGYVQSSDPFAPGAIQDSLGRIIPLVDYSDIISGLQPSAPIFVGCHTVQYPGMGQDTYPITYCNTLSQWTAGDGTVFPADLLTSVILPDGSSWSFTYNQVGMLSSVTTPRGETITYNSSSSSVIPTGPPGNYDSSYYITVQSKIVDKHDGSDPQEWNYSYGTLPGSGSSISCTEQSGSYQCQLVPFTCATCGLATTTVTSPAVNGIRNDTVHQFWRPSGFFDFEDDEQWQQVGGKEVGTIYYAGSVSDGYILKKIKNEYGYVIEPQGQEYPGLNRYDAGLVADVVLKSQSTQLDSGQVSKKEYDYSVDGQFFGKEDLYHISTFTSIPLSFGSLLSTKEYDYGLPQPDILNSTGPISVGPLIRTTTNVPWPNSKNFVDLIADSTVTDGSGNTLAHTANQYDDYGNLLSANHSVDSDSANDIVTSATYAAPHGMIDTFTDASGGVTKITYDAAGLYPSQVERPATLPGSVKHIDYYGYDTNTGLLLSHVDENGSGIGDAAHKTIYAYADPLYRLTSIYFPDGGQMTYSYPDINTAQYSRLVDASSNTWSSGITYSDQDGRKISEVTSGANGMWNHVDTCYDSLSRPTFTTYNYQTNSSTLSRVCPGASGAIPAGDSITYDALDRPTLVTHADASTIQTSYDGNSIDVKDEGHPDNSGTGTTYTEHVSAQDALGRIMSVCEVSETTLLAGATPSSCGMPISSPKNGYLTQYTYDGLGNLKRVQQPGVADRTFIYDYISRLTSSFNPESGTSSYSYDKNSNLTWKQDGAGHQTGFTWDALNRPLAKATSHETVAYSYDSATNGSGQLYQETTTSLPSLKVSSRRTITAYDAMGRVLNDEQCVLDHCNTGSTPYSLQYTYNAGGKLWTHTNAISTTGLGTVVLTNLYDSGANLNSSTALTAWGDVQHPSNLFSSPVYGPAGLTDANIGDHMHVHMTYDPRLRITGETVATQ